MDHTRPRLIVSGSQPDFDDLPAGDGILILSTDQVILSATLQVERLLKAAMGPINRKAEMQSKLQAMYNALKVSRVRWVLGVSLRRLGNRLPQSHAQPGLTEILTEEFLLGPGQKSDEAKGALGPQ
jgi:hypothetical protein